MPFLFECLKDNYSILESVSEILTDNKKFLSLKKEIEEINIINKKKASSPNFE